MEAGGPAPIFARMTTMKKHLVLAVLTLSAAGLVACASDEKKDQGLTAPTAGAADSMSSAPAPTPAPSADVSAMETTPATNQTEDYERSQRK
jgi:hypothetical protein